MSGVGEQANRLEALRRISDPQLRRLFDANIVGILISNNAGAILEANDALLDIIGYSRAELEHGLVDWRQLTPKEWLHLDELAIADLKLHGKFAQYEKEYIRKDGSRVPISVGGARIEGSVDEQICYIVDLSQIRLAQDALRRSETRFRALFEANVMGVFTFDADERIVKDANDEFLRIIGYDREDLARGSIKGDVVDPPEWVAARERARSEFDMLGRCEPFEREYIRKDGSRVPTLIGGARIDSEDGGNAICFALDLSEMKAIEAALKHTNAQLRESEQHFRTIADSLPIFASTVAPDGSVEWRNKPLCEYIGTGVEGARNWGWQSAIHPDDLAEVVARWTASLATGEPLKVEGRLKSRSGDYRWFLFRAHPMRSDDGQIVRWYATSTDIDDHKRALDRTVKIAETLQNIPLSGDLPNRPGVFFDACYLPAERAALIGGDWYGVFELPGGRLGITIGDVAGHGLEASVSTGKLRQTILTLMLEYDDPALVLQKLNRVFCYERKQPFATAFVGIVDAELRSLTYACAGHPPPVIVRSSDWSLQSLTCGDLPIGIIEDPGFTTHHVTLAPGDVVAFYTDGLIEHSRDIISGEEQLRAALVAATHGTHPDPARRIQSLLLPRGGIIDDVAILVMTLTTKPVKPEATGIVKTWRFHSADRFTASMIRRQVVASLAQYAETSDGLFEAELIIGEILANTVQHAPGIVEAELVWHDVEPTVRVTDSGPGFERRMTGEPGDRFLEHGRGLFLIATLAKDWSVRGVPAGGSEMTVTLPVRRRVSRPTPAARVRDERVSR